MKKLTIILFLFIFILSFSAQNNTISVKKNNLKNEIQFDGLYYSEPIIEEHKHNKIVSHKETRFYILLSNGSKVAVFHSSSPPEKVLKKMNRKKGKMIKESGNYSKSGRDLYFTVRTTANNYPKLYRYVALMINNGMYLNYKAAYKQKIALDIYLYKYGTLTDIPKPNRKPDN